MSSDSKPSVAEMITYLDGWVDDFNRPSFNWPDIKKQLHIVRSIRDHLASQPAPVEQSERDLAVRIFAEELPTGSYLSGFSTVVIKAQVGAANHEKNIQNAAALIAQHRAMMEGPLRDALAFYADPKNWEGASEAHDYGLVASNALSAAPVVPDPREPDWFWCDIDPDENGDSPYEAMVYHRPRLQPVKLHSSYAGPTLWGVMAPPLPDADDDSETDHTFATREEAEAFCKERYALAETAPQPGAQERT